MAKTLKDRSDVVSQDRLQELFRQRARELGRQGGLVRSERKARAARRNGKKGGRPQAPDWPEA